MNVDLNRIDLINLCNAVAKNTSGDISKHKYKAAFTTVNFVNGQFYKLSEVWVAEASDTLLLEFYRNTYPI